MYIINKIKNIENYILVYVYICLLTLTILIKEPSIQHILIILILLILNFILYKKFKFKNKLILYISIFIILINIILLFISHQQIINFGFNDGIIRGYIYKINYWDDYNYYYESEILKNYWLNGNISNWFKGITPPIIFYGYYNFYIILITLLKLIIGNNLISLILFKMQFTVINIYLVYYISSYFISEKYSIIPVLLTNLFPAYLQTNISLIRDNIILFYTLLVFYQINFKKVNKFSLIINIIIISWLRPYVGIPITILAYTYKYINSSSINFKKLIEYVFLIISFTIFLGILLKLMGYGFLALDSLKKIKDSGDIGIWNAKVTSSVSNLIIYNFRYLYLGDRVRNLSLFLYDDLLSLTYLFIPTISLPTILIFIIPNLEKKVKIFNYIIFIFAFFINILILYIFGGNVPRLYIPWFWGQTILFTYLIKYMKSKFKNNLFIFTCLNYLLFCTLVVTNYVI